MTGRGDSPSDILKEPISESDERRPLMPLRIPHIGSDDKLAERLSWPILEQFYPREHLERLIETQVKQTTYVRKLSVVITISVLICWNLYLRHSLGAVFRKLTNLQRWLGEEAPEALPTRGAWSYRRKQVGVELMRDLFEQSWGLLASHETPGAFAFGLRLMAIDGTLEDVNDTPENAAFFGRISQGKTRSPYPPLRCLYLLEAGTHAIVQIMLAPCQQAERSLAPGLLSAIEPGMLVLGDPGFLWAALIQAIRARGAHVLARLPQGVFVHHERDLPDGSYLTTLDAKTCEGLQESLAVRIIEYRLDPGVAEQLEQITPSRMHSHSSATHPQVHHVHRLL